MTAEQFRRLELALPDAAEAPHFQYASFRIGGRIFATLPPEGSHAHLFVSDDVREQALAMDPGSLENLPWGQRIVGLRVALAKAPTATVKRLLALAYEHRARPPARPRRRNTPG